jgi:sodium transport system permease protein
MMTVFLNLLKKEWMDAIRDKRAFTAAMMIAFVGPGMFGIALTMSLDRSQSVQAINISIEGIEHFESLSGKLARHHVYVDNDEAKDAEITVIIDPDFSSNLNEAVAGRITIRADYSDQKTSRRVRRVKDALNDFSSQLAGMRLIARGVSPSIIRPIEIVEQDTSTAQSRAGFILGMMSTFVLMSVFVSSTNVAIDSSAGERERNSLEFLLAQPVKTGALVWAKTLNTSFFGMIGAGLTLALMLVVLQIVPMHEVGLNFEFTPMMAFSIWLVLIPLATFAAGLQLATSFIAKTFKEAQSYINMTVMLPIMIPMMITMSNFEHPLLSWLPLTGQNQMINNFVKGVDIDILAVAVSSLSALGLSGLFVYIIARGLKTEKMILGL